MVTIVHTLLHSVDHPSDILPSKVRNQLINRPHPPKKSLDELVMLAPAAKPHCPEDAKFPLPGSDWTGTPQKLLPWQERQDTPENYEDAS